MRPTVTVGIPFFNERRFLAAAVRSILAQSFRDFEVLLVDDGSTDESVRIARGFDDPRVRVLTDGTRRHLATRLNQITDEACGRFLARMDADDIAHPERLARQLAALEHSTDPNEVSGTSTGLIDEREELFAIVDSSQDALTSKSALERGIMPHPTLFARREWFLEHRYDVTLTRTEDRDLWFRAAAETRFKRLPEPLYVMRVLARDGSFLPKYLEAQRQNRTLFRRYGPAAMGWGWVAKTSALSHAKSIAMIAADALGQSARLVRRRGRAPTDRERAMIDEALRAVR